MSCFRNRDCSCLDVYKRQVQSALGRADAVVKTANAVYVFEFKLNGTAEEALAQIDNRSYLIPYTTNGCHIVKIGAEFSLSLIHI